MGVRGIARDLAAAGVGKLKPLNVPQIDGSFDNRSKFGSRIPTAALPSMAGPCAD
jgi:phenylalanyl-tRNA synthetase beta chain